MRSCMLPQQCTPLMGTLHAYMGVTCCLVPRSARGVYSPFKLNVAHRFSKAPPVCSSTCVACAGRARRIILSRTTNKRRCEKQICTVSFKEPITPHDCPVHRIIFTLQRRFHSSLNKTTAPNSTILCSFGLDLGGSGSIIYDQSPHNGYLMASSTAF